MVIIYWLSRCHLPVDQQLLSRMKNFCEVAIGVKTSSTMAKKGRELLQTIDERVGRFKCFLVNLFLHLISQSRKDLIMSPTLSPSRKRLQDSDITPRHLAIALTLLEGDKYKAIVPFDYIAHLGEHPGSNGVKVACSVNNKIVLWVKQSVLHYDTAQSRAQRLEFFLNTAQVSRLIWELYIEPADQIPQQECRKLRNYGSLMAIGNALHSAPIAHLKLTNQRLSSSMSRELKGLKDICNPSSKHRGYHKVLNEVVDQEMRNYCVPWLGEDCFVDLSIGLTVKFIFC
jgi:son of sevenless-like protein